MEIVILEVGDLKTDAQSGKVNFNGNMDDYREHSIRDIKSNNGLKFLSCTELDNGGIVIEYYNNNMNGKLIRHYAFEAFY